MTIVKLACDFEFRTSLCNTYTRKSRHLIEVVKSVYDVYPYILSVDN